MASQTPIVVRNEKLTIHQGKGVLGVKGDLSKPAKMVRQDRKALRDISNVGKNPVLGATKGSTLKEKSVLCGRDTTKNASNNSFLTEERKKCHEWAKDGIEQTHFTGNDLQNHLKDMEEKRVRNEVRKVMSVLHKWSNISYDLGLPVKKFAKDSEDVMKLEMELEVFPPMTSLRPALVNEETEDLLCEREYYDLPSLDYSLDKLKLREDYDADITCA